MKLPITRWLFARHEWLELEIFEFTDIGDNWLPGLFDIGINLTFEGKIHAGRGQSFDRDLAVEKAGAEALERLALETWVHHGPGTRSSSGFAAHVTRAKAAERAKRELIERDILMCSMLSGTKFRQLSSRELRRTSPTFEDLASRLQKVGIDLKVAELPSDFEERVFIASAFGRRHKPAFGCNIGMGVSLQPRAAVEKSIQECLMMISLKLVGQKNKNLSLKQFKKIKKPNFTHHAKLGFNLKYAEIFEARFQSEVSTTRPMPKASRLFGSFEIENVDLPAEFKTCPVKIVRATNVNLQRVLLGVPKKKELNFERLSRYERRLSKADRLTHFENVHVLG